MDDEEELQAKVEAAMIARLKKIKDVNKLENKDKENRDKETAVTVYSATELNDNIKNNKEKGVQIFYFSLIFPVNVLD